MRERTLHPLLALIPIMIIGALLRYDFTTPFNFIIDSDEAIVGLMAKHILEGQKIPTFYYGQHYMGSLEAILAAGSFSLFGISNWSLKLVPFVFSIALIPIIYALTRKLANSGIALTAALLIAVPPAPLVVWSSKARGGFIEVIVIGALALLTTCIWLQRDHARLRWVFLTGLLLGLGWWVNNQVIFFMLPIGLAFLQGTRSHAPSQRLKETFVNAVTGLSAFILGGLPFWLYNFERDFITFGMFGGASSKDLSKHLSGLFSTALPIILGGRRFWQEDEFYPGGGEIALLLYGTLVFLALIYRFREFFRCITLRGISRERPVELLLVFVLSTTAIFSLSSFGYLVQAPRYLLPIYVGLMPLCAYGLAPLGQPLRSLLLGLLLAVNLSSSYWGEKAVPGEPFVAAGERASVDHHELIEWLESSRYSFVKTNYWIGYRLAFETQEKVKFLVFQEPYQVRIPEYQDAGKVLDEREIPLVLVPSQAIKVRAALDALGMSYHQKTLSGYTVLYDLESRNRLASLSPLPHGIETATAIPHGHDAAAAIDGSLKTRWGSGEHQYPGMKFIISLKRPTRIREIRIDLGEWAHDFPRRLQVILHKENGVIDQLISEDQYDAIQYLRLNEPIELAIKPTVITGVELQQTGKHPVFDWSIAEVELLQ